MQEKCTPAGVQPRARDGLSPAEKDARNDYAVLDVLLHRDGPGVWCEQEVAREIGDPLATADSLSRLARSGLVHRHAGFVVPSRAAVHMEGIID